MIIKFERMPIKLYFIALKFMAFCTEEFITSCHEMRDKYRIKHFNTARETNRFQFKPLYLSRQTVVDNCMHHVSTNIKCISKVNLQDTLERKMRYTPHCW